MEIPIERLLNGEEIILHESRYARRSDAAAAIHWRAVMTLEEVLPQLPQSGGHVNLCGDSFAATIRFYCDCRGPKPLEYVLPCGDPDLWDGWAISNCIHQVEQWAKRICELLDEPPDLWPFGD